MDDFNASNQGLLARLLRDPVQLRRRSSVAAVVLAALSGLAGSGWLLNGVASAFLTAFVWLLVPAVAAGIGIGDAFFLRHGIGGRRIAATTIAAVLVATLSCVILAIINTSEDGAVLAKGMLYALLVVGVVLALAAFIAFAVGKSERYLSRRIQDVDDTGW